MFNYLCWLSLSHQGCYEVKVCPQLMINLSHEHYDQFRPSNSVTKGSLAWSSFFLIKAFLARVRRATEHFLSFYCSKFPALSRIKDLIWQIADSCLVDRWFIILSLTRGCRLWGQVGLSTLWCHCARKYLFKTTRIMATAIKICAHAHTHKHANTQRKAQSKKSKQTYEGAHQWILT